MRNNDRVNVYLNQIIIIISYSVRITATYLSAVFCFTAILLSSQSINHTILTCDQKRTSSQLSLPHGTVN